MSNSLNNKPGFAPLHATLSHSGYAIYIHSNALSFLNEAIQDNYASFKLIKKIIAMRSNPRPWDGGIKKGTTDHRQLAIDGIWVNYFIESGCVYIDNITFNHNAKKRHEPAGLHLVKRDNNEWIISKTYVKDITTSYAAVNGQNNTRAIAAIKVMPVQLVNAYSGEEINEFTLFHNPTHNIFADTYESARDKLGFTTPVTKSFSKLLLKTQQQQHEVKWVAHSQGGAIFSQAVNVHNKNIGSSLNKHTVFFQASANNMMMTKTILNKAGVKLHKDGYNNSPIDGVPQVIGLNALTDVLMKPSITSLARLAGSPLAFFPGMIPMAFTSTNFSTHTMPYEGLGNYGKKVVNSSKNMINNLVQRIV